MSLEEKKLFEIIIMIGFSMFFYAAVRMMNLMFAIMGSMQLYSFDTPLDGFSIAVCFSIGMLIMFLSTEHLNYLESKTLNSKEDR
jgi:hypothetical protein